MKREFIDGLDCAAQAEADGQDVLDEKLIDCRGPRDDGAVVHEAADRRHFDKRRNGEKIQDVKEHKLRL